MTPIRVDRDTHNDRIDEKIRKEITKADIVVADLTYARPSVYWEAGFAERVVPVVYTCRSDHFRQGEDDIFGNFVVHFDLKNANIEIWNSIDDKVFKNNLRKCLNFVAKNIRAEKEAQSAKRIARKCFLQIALNEKRTLVSEILSKTILAFGFISFSEKTSKSMSPYPNQFLPVYYKVVGSTVIIVYLYYCFDKL